MEITAEQVTTVLEDPAQAEHLNDEQLDLAVHAAIGLYGTSPEPALVEKLLPLYHLYVGRSHPAVRVQNYQAIADRVITKAAGAQALVPFICCDPDRTIASAAALDYTVLAPGSSETPTLAASELLDLYERGALTNGPAVLGGLLLSGDRRIISLIEATCHDLEVEAVVELIHLRSPFVAAAVVEFYLAWLEQLDSVDDEEMYGLVAAGLANLALGAAEPMVYDVERVIPSSPDDAVRVLGQWALPDYAAILAERLQELARNERGEPIVPDVMAAWGI